jgi:tetratricopeptide (TPR) repeat protein
MIEQADVSAIPSAPVGSFRLELSEEARASLQAVREAQEAARLQARRQTQQARLWFLTAVGALVLAGVTIAPRLSHWWHARRHPGTMVSSAKPAATSGSSAMVAAAQTAEASTPALESAAPSAASEEGCDTDAVRSTPWRLSPEACARAFALHPNDPTLALAVAHAEHAHGHLLEGAQWAKRALALDPDAAEAYVLIARADVADGRHEDARAAYHHYLQLAPRGWHHSEARAALRPSRAKTSAN